MDMSDLKIDMNDMIMADSPIRFPGLFGDWTFTASSKAIDVGHGVYWYGILIALGLLLALLLLVQVAWRTVVGQQEGLRLADEAREAIEAVEGIEVVKAVETFEVLHPSARTDKQEKAP